jgi:radical SAM protein with 4Fe4S-binding SPASM domain
MIDTFYFHTTRQCNLNCEYCYFSAGSPMDEELSTEEMLKTLNDICLLEPRRLVFTGGESLLRNDIIELSHFVRDNGKSIQLCLTSNGLLINYENVLEYSQLFDEIRISIDCFENLNDKSRGDGCFEKAMSALKLIANFGGNPVAFITVSKINLPFLKEFMQFLLINGISKMHISPLKQVGRAIDNKMICSQEEIKGVVDSFWVESFGLKIIHKSKRKLINCGVGKFISINPDGSVYPCHVLSFSEFCIGNVKNEPLHSIIEKSTLMNNLRNLNLDKLSKCTSCYSGLSSQPFCLGLHMKDNSSRSQLFEVLEKMTTKISKS